MPPYFRFPEPEAIKQRFWGIKPRNPTCGLVSLEKGTKIFAYINIFYGAALFICCIIIFLSPLLGGSINHQEILKNLKENPKHRQDVEWIEKIYMNHSMAVIQSIVFFSFIFFSTWWYISWKLKKAIVEHDLPKLKKYYVLMLTMMVIVMISTLWESEMLWSKAFLIDIPCYILQIMGLLFTHAYIASLMSPDSCQHDDLNRIQFNP